MDAIRVGLPVGLVGAALLEVGGVRVAGGALLALCLFGLAVTRPLAALYVGILSIAVDAFTIPVGGSQLHPYELIFILTAAGWVCRRVGRRQTLMTYSPLLLPTLFLVLTSWVGLLVVPDPVTVLRIPLMWTIFFVLYQLVVSEGDARTVRQIALALCIVGGVSGILAITQTGAMVCGPTSCVSVGTAQALGQAGNAARATTSAFAQPNRLGEFLALVIPFQLALGFSGSRPARLLGFACLIPTSWALALTLSREAFLGIAIAAVFALFVSRVARRLLLVLVVGVILILTLGVNPLGGAGSTLGARIQSIEHASSDPRVIAYEKTPKMVLQHPVFGIGPDQYASVSGSYGIVDPNTGFPLVHAHSLVLNIAAERGLLGLSVLVWWLVSVARVLRRVHRGAGGSERVFALALLASFLTLVAGALADYSWQQNNLLALTWVLTGVAVLLDREFAGLRAPGAGGGQSAQPA